MRQHHGREEPGEEDRGGADEVARSLPAGTLALLLAALRLALIWGIAESVVRGAALSDTPARFAWMGLISQAGVTLGLATILASEFPAWGRPVRTVIVALTGLHIVIGPILLKAALARAGEIPSVADPFD